MDLDEGNQLLEAHIEPLPLERFDGVLASELYDRFLDAMHRGARTLEGRTLWHINATLAGGGVAEMLGSVVPYLAGGGINCRWMAVEADDDFFTVTKRLHNYLHGSKGDGGDLGRAEAEIYASTLTDEEANLIPQVEPGDVVFVHDPQTAGFIPALVEREAAVIWHCHIGVDEPNDHVRYAWDFLLDHVAPAHRYIFSRPAYLWDTLDADRLRVIPPSIDVFSPKNQDLDTNAMQAILRATGIVEGSPTSTPTFARSDGTTGTVSRKVSLIDGHAPPPEDASIVVQSARWDRLKDPAGVIALFADHIAGSYADVHLVVAGPSVDEVPDDPESLHVLNECRDLRASLPPDVRARVHLMCSPMEDEDETAAIVNVMQRRADVVVQKSLAEGFGLVVAEAMWKERPVVSTRVGGIQDQIEHGRSGILVDDPSDGAAFARAVAELLDDHDRAARMGAEARARVLDRFLAPRQLCDTMQVVSELL